MTGQEYVIYLKNSEIGRIKYIITFLEPNSGLWVYKMLDQEISFQKTGENFQNLNNSYKTSVNTIFTTACINLIKLFPSSQLSQ
jgi:hypothetical protein